MSWYGSDESPTLWAWIVDDYFHKKMLRTMGFTFDGEKLTDFEIQAYQIIMFEANKLEKLDLATMKK